MIYEVAHLEGTLLNVAFAIAIGAEQRIPERYTIEDAPETPFSVYEDWNGRIEKIRVYKVREEAGRKTSTIHGEYLSGNFNSNKDGRFIGNLNNYFKDEASVKAELSHSSANLGNDFQKDSEELFHLIEAHKIKISFDPCLYLWSASIGRKKCTGKSLAIAILRVVVRAKFGSKIEIRDEFLDFCRENFY